MKSPPPPEKKRAGEGVNPNRHQENRVDAELIPDPCHLSNRQLLRRRGRHCVLRAVPRSIELYGVTAPIGNWKFSLMFRAESKFNGVISRIGGANRP